MVRFAHISDTHIRRDYKGCALGEAFEALTDPNTKLRACLENIRKQKVDFVIMTGDLVHEGTEGDYRHLRGMIEEYLPDIPVLACLGNHDRKEAFFRGYLGTEARDDYCCRQTIKGLRIVTLDTSVSGRDDGELSARQIEWLNDLLQERAEEGTILILHHPVVWHEALFFMDVPEAFRKAVRNGDVVGIFCGHTHYNNSLVFENVPQIAGDSTAFAGVFTTGEVAFIDRSAYNICTVSNRQISVHNELIWPEIGKRFDFDPEIIREHSKKAMNIKETIK